MNEETRELLWEFTGSPAIRWSVAVLWCTFAAAVGVMTAVVGVSPIGVVVAAGGVATAVGVVGQVSWLKFVALPVGVGSMVFFGLLLISAPYPQIVWWWVGALVVGLGAATIAIALAGFPAGRRARDAG